MIDWFKRDPLFNSIMIILVIALGSCCVRSLVQDIQTAHDWPKEFPTDCD